MDYVSYYNETMASLQHQVAVKSPWFLLLLICITVYIAYFTTLSFLRHDNLHSSRFDLGNMDQTVWNIARGNGFSLTDPYGEEQISRLGVHADFLLIALAPLYLLWSDPKVLLTVQTIVLALGALPVFFFAWEKLRIPWLAFVFGLSYMLYPPLQKTNLFDFHAVTLSTTFLLWSYWYMHKGKSIGFTIYALAAALGKEHVWPVTALMGIYYAIGKRRWGIGMIVAIISVSVFYLLFWWFIPWASVTKQHFALSYLSEFGTDQTSIIINILTHPQKIISTFFLPDRLAYLYRLLSPYGFLSLLSPTILLLASPSILLNILSSNELMRRVDFQYDSTVTPFIVLSAIYGFTRVKNWIRMIPVGTYLGFFSLLPAIWLIAWAVSTTYLWDELPYMQNSRFFTFISPQAEKQAVLLAERTIDPEHTVSVTNNIGAHFSRRQYLWNFPIKALSADFVLVKLEDPYAWPSNEAQKEMVDALFFSDRYRSVIQFGTFYVFKRRDI